MPVVEVNVVTGRHDGDRLRQLLVALSERYAEVLGSPVERVRAYVTPHRPEHWATGGVPGVEAPYFTAVVLAGRPGEQRRRLVAELTDVIVEVLGTDRGLVRGRIVQVDPDDWAIGGTPASVARADEIEARAAGSI